MSARATQTNKPRDVSTSLWLRTWFPQTYVKRPREHDRLHTFEFTEQKWRIQEAQSLRKKFPRMRARAVLKCMACNSLTMDSPHCSPTSISISLPDLDVFSLEQTDLVNKLHFFFFLTIWNFYRYWEFNFLGLGNSRFFFFSFFSLPFTLYWTMKWYRMQGKPHCWKF